MTDDDLGALDPNVRWIVAEARRPVVVDAAARARLLAAVRSAPRPERPSRFRAWLLEPRHLALPPLAALAAAAGLVGIGVIAGLLFNRDGRPSIERGPIAVVESQLPDSLRTRVIKFVLIAPQAARVAVVGDFNGWDLAATPATRQPDGTWSTFVSLPPGRHVYSFVVDDQFISDPDAPRAPDDGFGQNNSVIVVGGASS
jgi:hypothetical protein